MNMPVVISFFTVGTPYEEEVQRLRASCERFGLDYLIAAKEPRNSWVQNCAMKGPFVLEQLERAQRPVLWIDADGEVVAPLDYFVDAGFDFGCYVRWSVQKDPPTLDSPSAPFMSGTVFVNYTPGTRLG